MYEVQMKYIDTNDIDEPFMFACENFNVENNGYRFEKVFMKDFVIGDLEVNNEDIALIKIK